MDSETVPPKETAADPMAAFMEAMGIGLRNPDGTTSANGKDKSKEPSPTNTHQELRCGESGGNGLSCRVASDRRCYKCCVTGCRSTDASLDSNGRQLHFFEPPKNRKTLAQWNKAIPELLWCSLPMFRRVCALHFVNGQPSNDYPVPMLNLQDPNAETGRRKKGAVKLQSTDQVASSTGTPKSGKNRKKAGSEEVSKHREGSVEFTKHRLSVETSLSGKTSSDAGSETGGSKKVSPQSILEKLGYKDKSPADANSLITQGVPLKNEPAKDEIFGINDSALATGDAIDPTSLIHAHIMNNTNTVTATKTAQPRRKPGPRKRVLAGGNVVCTKCVHSLPAVRHSVTCMEEKVNTMVDLMKTIVHQQKGMTNARNYLAMHQAGGSGDMPLYPSRSRMSQHERRMPQFYRGLDGRPVARHGYMADDMFAQYARANLDTMVGSDPPRTVYPPAAAATEHVYPVLPRQTMYPPLVGQPASLRQASAPRMSVTSTFVNKPQETKASRFQPFKPQDKSGITVSADVVCASNETLVSPTGEPETNDAKPGPVKIIYHADTKQSLAEAVAKKYADKEAREGAKSSAINHKIPVIDMDVMNEEIAKSRGYRLVKLPTCTGNKIILKQVRQDMDKEGGDKSRTSPPSVPSSQAAKPVTHKRSPKKLVIEDKSTVEEVNAVEPCTDIGKDHLATFEDGKTGDDVVSNLAERMKAGMNAPSTTSSPQSSITPTLASTRSQRIRKRKSDDMFVTTDIKKRKRKRIGEIQNSKKGDVVKTEHDYVSPIVNEEPVKPLVSPKQISEPMVKPALKFGGEKAEEPKKEKKDYLLNAVARVMLMFPGRGFTLRSLMQFGPIWLHKFPEEKLNAVVKDLVGQGLLKSIGMVDVNDNEHSPGYSKVDYDRMRTNPQLKNAIRNYGCSVEGYKNSFKTGSNNKLEELDSVIAMNDNLQH